MIYQSPKAPSQTTSENHFGISIEDEFRNLENQSDPEVIKWFKEEASYADKLLGNISGQEQLLQKINKHNERKSHTIKNLIITEGNQYFYLRQSVDEPVARLFYRKSYSSEDELLFDPKNYKPELKKLYLINYISTSWDGSYIVVAMTHSDIEISEMIIIDMATKKPIPIIIDHCWPAEGRGIHWLPDNSGFIYLYHPSIDPSSDTFLKETKSVIYKIGDDPKDLKIIFSRASHPELDIRSEDFPSVCLQNKEDKYLLGSLDGASFYTDVYYAKVKNLSADKIEWKTLYKKEDKIIKGFFHKEKFIYLSSKKFSNFQLLSISLDNLDFNKATVLVQYKKDEVITDFKLTSECIFFTTTRNGVESKMYTLINGKEAEIELPTKCGSISLYNKGQLYSDLWITTVSWIKDSVTYIFENNKLTELHLTPKVSYPEFEDFVVEELLATSHDGVEIPLSVIHKKGILLNGLHPTLFFGYGAYGISVNPSFKPTVLTWVEEGGIYCIAHVRGGGEKGAQWHEAGSKASKPNSWKDLIACTEYMIQKGYTSNNKTVIWSGSAGGILVGRAMTERPDLFAVVISRVGLMNPFRSEFRPSGLNGIKEFGTTKILQECKALINMDPYLNIEKDTNYPATLVTAGMNDTRVPPWQPGKFVAKLQRYNKSNNPIIFDVNYNSGHGLNDINSNYFKLMAKLYAFAFWQTGNSNYQLRNDK